MRKLIFQEFLSIDGYAADSNNGTSFLESPELNKDSDIDMLSSMDNFDTILLGANTYKMFVDFWPTEKSANEIVADKLNSIPKIVFSKTLKKAPWGKWPDARIVSDAIKEVKKLKAMDGKDMVLWGSISIAQQFMNENLVDEYHFRICPVTLGKGRLLFENTGEMNLELMGSKQYASGLMLLQYRPAP
jgi:dihydrofolate reductase